MTELLRSAGPGIVIALVGNKLDLADHDRQVSFEEAEEYAKESDLLFNETSARTGDGVVETFLKIARKLPRTEQQLASPRLAADGRRVDLHRGMGADDAYRRINSSNNGGGSKCC